MGEFIVQFWVLVAALFLAGCWVCWGWIVKAYPNMLKKRFGGTVKNKDLDIFKPSKNGDHRKRA